MITDEMVGTVAHLMTGLYRSTCCHKTGGHGGQHMVEGCECRATARAALTAVLPMIRAEALEEAAKVADARAARADVKFDGLVKRGRCGEINLELAAAAAAGMNHDARAVATVLRAMKGTVHE